MTPHDVTSMLTRIAPYVGYSASTFDTAGPDGRNWMSWTLGIEECGPNAHIASLAVLHGSDLSEIAWGKVMEEAKQHMSNPTGQGYDFPRIANAATVGS